MTPRERAWHRRGIELTEAGYAEMFAAQGGVCALCGRPPTARQALAPDHDHKTGRIRGLVCWECNKLILGTLDRYGPARRRRVIDRLWDYYDMSPPARLVDYEIVDTPDAA